jgi:hypothetical protein
VWVFLQKNNPPSEWISFKNHGHARGFFENSSVFGMEATDAVISLNVHEQQVPANQYLCGLISSDKPH